jgi:hypothetical protein
MDVLEKILEEIEERIKRLNEADNMCRVNAERNRNFESMKYFQSFMFATERAESIIGDIIRSHMDEARDTNVPSNDGWIQVEDELPKETEKEYYPAMYVTTSYGVVAWGFYRVKDEQWYLYNDIMEEFESVENNKIIAWQPLPEPYKIKKDIPTAKNTQQEMEDFWRDK